MESENSTLRNEGLESETNVLPLAAHLAPQPAALPLKQEARPNPATAMVTFVSKNLIRRKHREDKPAFDSSDKMLEDAEYLLKHAAQAGIKLDKATVRTIISAGAADKLSNEETAKAFAAVTQLAEKLKPVTAETLRACERKAPQTIHFYLITAILLGSFLLVSSVLSFIAGGLSKSLTDDINLANQLAVTLNSDAAPQQAAALQANASSSVDPKSLTNLQQFAATIRDMYGLSHELSWFVLASDAIPVLAPTTIPNVVPGTNVLREEDMEIKVPEPPARVDIPKEVQAKTQILQKVRYLAKDIQERTSLWYGALSNFLLPPLYAMLGACAYLLRSFSEQVKARTFTPSTTDGARFIIAAIGGGAVGLFSNFTPGEVTSLSPLAIAFLVGYATDIFFSFLDGLQPAFTKAKSSQGGSG